MHLCFISFSSMLFGNISFCTIFDEPASGPACCSSEDKMKAMARLLSKIKDLRYDDKALVKRFKSMLEATENQLRNNKKQSNFLSQLAAKTMPKGLHCLSMRLTVSYNTLPLEERDFPATPELEDNSLYHYAIFSDNVLAVSVVVNSTVVSAEVILSP